jgi:ATP-dependent Clp protease ATP-binding subunit ClpA
MAKMLRRAVDEVSEMQAEAQAEAEALIAAAEAKNEAAQRKYNELLADIAAQRQALETEYEETKKKQDAELATMRAETQSAIDKAWHNAQQEHEQLLADAQQGADQHREQTRRAVDEANQQRIKILEQLVGVYRVLEGFPAALESAYQERKNPPEASVVVPLRPEFNDDLRESQQPARPDDGDSVTGIRQPLFKISCNSWRDNPMTSSSSASPTVGAGEGLPI